MSKRKSIYHYLNILSVIICVASVILPMIFWKQIPEIIPTHFNAFGEPDAHGNKSILILIFFGEFITLGSMLFANVLIKMTSSSQNSTNTEKLTAQIIRPMLSVLNFVLVLMFAYMIYCSATCRSMGKWFLAAVLLGTFLPLVFYLSKYLKETGNLKRQNDTEWKEKEINAVPTIYRSKVDVWLGVLLLGSIALPIWLLIDDFIKDSHVSIVLLLTDIFLIVLVLPLFFIRYYLYEEHLKVSCGIYGTVRIPYKSITSMKKTLNPLSSAALSMKRIQIDYNKDGSSGMILISPKNRGKFIAEIEKRK